MNNLTGFPTSMSIPIEIHQKFTEPEMARGLAVPNQIQVQQEMDKQFYRVIPIYHELRLWGYYKGQKLFVGV